VKLTGAGMLSTGYIYGVALASGGAGGKADGTGAATGAGGAATSRLTFNDVKANTTHASSMQGRSYAYGGAFGGAGGAAAASLTLTGAFGVRRRPSPPAALAATAPLAAMPPQRATPSARPRSRRLRRPPARARFAQEQCRVGAPERHNVLIADAQVWHETTMVLE
jgi:hypothetical protein